MFEALNAMMLDMLAAIARKDYDDRPHRQMQGIAKAKSGGKYRSRAEALRLDRRSRARPYRLKRGKQALESVH
jgi:DNA invertase Pin-like site-specific DNA recombinase